MRVGWDNQTEGAYDGVFGQDRVIRGSTFDVEAPEVHRRLEEFEILA